MRFGLFGGPNRGKRDDATAYREYVDLVAEAEDLGFFGVYLVEHHFTGRGQLSSSLSLLSHLAARTSTMRLGTAVVVLPWHNPVLLAEQAATVDVLSDGPLDLGIGRGYRDYEFRGFGIPMDSAQARADEAMAVIRLAWTAEGRFAHHGEYWHFDDVVIEPAPVQRPHPPLWMGVGSPESIDRAAREGYGIFLDQVAAFEEQGARVARYRAAREAAGLAYDARRASR
ncbi:MAG: LLM class flavin-dependent oxidoreductase [Dehalococcoidia bacterium]|nr:LLM class flavin-dependent oxidoreductase [Dehalococcoidia bacterium]